MKYLYMGTAIGSSNYALPTSRLLHYLRARKSKHLSIEKKQPLRTLKKEKKRGRIGAIFCLVHRLCEEWFRQSVSWILQMQGYVLLYDRHFIFECAPDDIADQEPRRLSDRIHFWMLSHVYPKPEFIFFLDAPPEVLFERKPEATLEYLEVRRTTYLKLGRQLSNFFRIDATRPPKQVLADIQNRIDRIQGDEMVWKKVEEIEGVKGG